MNMRHTSLAAPQKATILQKEAVARLQSRIAPVYLVNEYPKSGGTWLKFMLAETLGLPAWTKGKPVWAPCVMQAHWLQPKGNCRTVALFRDGRDVMVSFYYHALFRNEFQNGPLVRIVREKLKLSDLEDTRSNLLPFMKLFFDTPISPNFSWIDFVNEWAQRPGVVTCRYEDLRSDTAGELCRLHDALTGRSLERATAEAIAESYSMPSMRQRKAELHPGLKGQQDAETSFIRKGSVGGWSEHFADDALEWFEDRAGTALDKLGYARGRPETPG